MNGLKPLKEFLAERQDSGIAAIAQYIEGHVEVTWQKLLQTNRDQLLDAYIKAGDMAYGTYLNLLFLPIHRQFAQADLVAEPKFPGDFDISREWGDEQSDRQRWMWSTVKTNEGEPLGTIVTIVYHDHTQFRVSRKPAIIALTETGKEAVVEALSKRSADFGNAREFTVEYADYLRSQQG